MIEKLVIEEVPFFMEKVISKMTSGDKKEYISVYKEYEPCRNIIINIYPDNMHSIFRIKNEEISEWSKVKISSVDEYNQIDLTLQKHSHLDNTITYASDTLDGCSYFYVGKKNNTLTKWAIMHDDKISKEYLEICSELENILIKHVPREYKINQ